MALPPDASGGKFIVENFKFFSQSDRFAMLQTLFI